jgi:hypothetical protein
MNLWRMGNHSHGPRSEGSIQPLEPRTPDPGPRIPDRGLEQLPNRPQIQIEFVGRDVELTREIGDGLLKTHQRQTDVLGLGVRERALFHAANRLPLEELADEFYQRED